MQTASHGINKEINEGKRKKIRVSKQSNERYLKHLGQFKQKKNYPWPRLGCYPNISRDSNSSFSFVTNK